MISHGACMESTGTPESMTFMPYLAAQNAIQDGDVSAEVVLAPGLTPPIPVTPGQAYGFEFNEGLGSIQVAG